MTLSSVARSSDSIMLLETVPAACTTALSGRSGPIVADRCQQTRQRAAIGYVTGRHRRLTSELRQTGLKSAGAVGLAAVATDEQHVADAVLAREVLGDQGAETAGRTGDDSAGWGCPADRRRC